jgi:hypothetical protein
MFPMMGPARGQRVHGRRQAQHHGLASCSAAVGKLRDLLILALDLLHRVGL